MERGWNGSASDKGSVLRKTYSGAALSTYLTQTGD